MTVRMTLTWDDVETASYVGLRRFLAARQNGTAQNYGKLANGEGAIEQDIYGAVVEFAIAQYFNLNWRSQVGRRYIGKVDVGGCIEARSARRITDSLLLHPPDDDDLPFVLGVVERLPVVELCGWIFARHGKQEEYWRDPIGNRPAFFVPQSVLLSMPELQSHLRRKLGRYAANETLLSVREVGA